MNCLHCGKPINPAALMGSARSKAKTAAARRNGKRGGWPKGRRRGRIEHVPFDVYGRRNGELVSVRIMIPVRIDLSNGQEILTAKAHDMIDEAKAKLKASAPSKGKHPAVDPSL